MEKNKKMEVVKRLEDLVAFRQICLSTGKWEESDLIEGKIHNLEREIIVEE